MAKKIANENQPLTVREKKFADIYLETGEKRKSYEATFKCKNPKTAATEASTLLRKPNVAKYIRDRMAESHAKAVAKQDEVLSYITSVMRGEVKDQLGFETSVRDRNKAAELLGKRYGVFDPGSAEKEEAMNQVKETVIPAKYLGKAFVDVNRWIDNRDYMHYWFDGGRGSLKSSFISLKFIELIENNPTFCGIAIRKVANTLKDSVLSQLQWAIDLLGLTEEYKVTVSPMAIYKRTTGQQIYFRGADEPAKIKSIRPKPGMYIAVAWYEEVDQFFGMRELRMINQSIMRGGEDFVMFYSYNVPRSRQHWINQEKLNQRDDKLNHSSTYLDAPKEWLGQPFFDEAEHLKIISPDDYENEYMGEATGNGGAVFDKLEIREISDEEIKTFGYCYQGLDWGWFPDPLCWLRVCYNAKQETIYLFDEIYGCKITNEDAATQIKKRNAIEEDILCDSAEPKSIRDVRDMGLNAREATKGPGSVEYGMKWLQKRKIVIDPERCPNAAREFSSYEYERNPDGEYMSGYPDKDNHSIDCTRYSLSRVMRYIDSKA